MAGCYGNNWEDRARERELDAYLDSLHCDDYFCVRCEHRTHEPVDDYGHCTECAKDDEE